MAAVAHSHNLGAEFWRLADPKITLASMSSILLGAAAAVHSGAQAWGWLLLVVLGIFALEWAKNASGCERPCEPTCTATLAFWAAATIALPSSRVQAAGFST